MKRASANSSMTITLILVFGLSFPLFLMLFALLRQGSAPQKESVALDYSFRTSTSLSDSETDEIFDPDVARVESEKAFADQWDRARLPAAAQFCQIATELQSRNSSKDEIQKLNQRMRELQVGLQGGAREVFSENSPLFAEGQAPTTPVGKFMLGLRKSGMIEGLPWSEPDYEEASKMMSELRQEDPGNAAPMIFQLMIEMRRGVPVEDLTELIQDIARARHFDTYYTGAVRELRDAAVSWQDPSAFLLVSSFLSTMPVPNYGGLTSIVNEMSDRVPELKANLSEVMIRGAQEARESMNSFAYSAMDYAHGRALADAEIPYLSELDQQKIQPPIALEDMSFDVIECGDQTYQEYLSKLSKLKATP